MFSLISRIKDRLSHVKTSTWHYKAVNVIWGWRANTGKACTYYWFKLPTSLLALFVITLLGAIITIIGWFFGRTPTWIKTEAPDLKWYHEPHSGVMFYPNGLTAKGKKRHIIPWWFGAVALVLSAAYYLVFVEPTIGLILALIVLVTFATAGFIYVLAKNWNNPAIRNARAGVKAAWDKACPPLVIVENGEKDRVAADLE